MVRVLFSNMILHLQTTDVSTMATSARLVENVGVGAYSGAAHLIDDPRVLTVAASILPIEARHQTVLNTFNTGAPIPQAFDIALTPPEVVSIVGGFISNCDLGIQGTHFSRITRNLHPKAHSPFFLFSLHPSANPSLTITNTGAIAAGTSLKFTLPPNTGNPSVSRNIIPIGAITLSHTRRVHRASTVRYLSVTQRTPLPSRLTSASCPRVS
jgi:hypothetical protein